MSKGASDVIVRLATIDDVELLHRFSVELATYEDEPDAVTSTPQTLARDGFGRNPQFAALIAEQGGKPVGFALYTFNYSVVDGRARHLHRGYLGCARGAAGRRRARADGRAGAGVRRPRLPVASTSTCSTGNPARGFYERIGFKWIRNWLPYRLSGEALEKLATLMIFRTARILRAHDHERAGCARSKDYDFFLRPISRPDLAGFRN